MFRCSHGRCAAVIAGVRGGRFSWLIHKAGFSAVERTASRFFWSGRRRRSAKPSNLRGAGGSARCLVKRGSRCQRERVLPIYPISELPLCLPLCFVGQRVTGTRTNCRTRLWLFLIFFFTFILYCSLARWNAPPGPPPRGHHRGKRRGCAPARRGRPPQAGQPRRPPLPTPGGRSGGSRTVERTPGAPAAGPPSQKAAGVRAGAAGATPRGRAAAAAPLASLAELHSITFSLWAVAAYALPGGVCADLSVGAV